MALYERNTKKQTNLISPTSSIDLPPSTLSRPMDQISVLEHNVKIFRTIKKYGCQVSQIPQQVHLAFPQSDSPNSQQAIARNLASRNFAPMLPKLKTVKSPDGTSEVIEHAYRAVERFLVQQCGKQLKPISKQSLKRLIPFLTNFHKNLEEEEIITFISFLRATFGLGITFSSEYFAAKLVSVLMQIAKRLHKKPKLQSKKTKQSRITSKEKGESKEKLSPMLQEKNPIGKNLFKRQTETDKLNKIWDDRMEVALLKWVKDNEYFLKIRDEFRKDFPQHQDILTVESLKNRFYKILRAGLKKLKWLQSRLTGMPELQRLDDTHVKYILRSSEGHKVRKHLVQIYIMKEGDNSQSRLQVTMAIQAVNNCIIE